MQYSCNMKNDYASNSVFWELLQLMYQSKHRFYEIADEFDLTVTQASALMMLSENDPKPMKMLSGYFMCDASKVTGLIDHLEGRKLIYRENHPTDRRVTLISLTSAGVEVKLELSARMDFAEVTALHNVLSETERQSLHTLVRRILDAPIESFK